MLPRQLRLIVSAAIVVVTMSDVVPADETKSVAKSRDEVLAGQRLAAMQQRIAAAGVDSREGKFPKKFESKAIFRFSDPARGCVAAAVWKLEVAAALKAVGFDPVDVRVRAPYDVEDPSRHCYVFAHKPPSQP